MLAELLRNGAVTFCDVGRDGEGDGFAEERAGGRAILQMSIESREETADLRVVELSVADELDPAALCDIGDAALEQQGINAKECGCARPTSGDSGGF